MPVSAYKPVWSFFRYFNVCIDGILCSSPMASMRPMLNWTRKSRTLSRIGMYVVILWMMYRCWWPMCTCATDVSSVLLFQFYFGCLCGLVQSFDICLLLLTCCNWLRFIQISLLGAAEEAPYWKRAANYRNTQAPGDQVKQVALRIFTMLCAYQRKRNNQGIFKPMFPAQ